MHRDVNRLWDGAVLRAFASHQCSPASIPDSASFFFFFVVGCVCWFSTLLREELRLHPMISSDSCLFDLISV